jgi:hypothetical protein
MATVEMMDEWTLQHQPQYVNRGPDPENQPELIQQIWVSPWGLILMQGLESPVLFEIMV